MAKNGFKIFDSDTHVGPYVDILDRYMTAGERERLKAWEPYKRVGQYSDQGGQGHITYTKGERKYARRLREANVEDSLKSYNAVFQVRERERPISLRVDDDPAERIADMDYEGVDANFLLPSGWFGTWTSGDDVPLEMAMYRAYHEWMNDYCSKFPDRLGGLILCCARDVQGSVAEIRRWCKSRWPWGILVYAPAGYPLDHPALEPIWAATAEHDLAVTLHTFTAMPPYAPGGLDNWDNLFLQRSAAHPWCGMRNMAALIGCGLMDRYPSIRIGPLEAGHSWLPFWMKRTDEHAHTVRNGLPADLKMTPSEYVCSGRYYQSIEMSEGDRLTNMVSEIVGDDVLMYASDYPHGESWYPRSVDTVMAWNMPADRKRKLFWDNAVRFYARCGLK